jgi:hypothetical protein
MICLSLGPKQWNHELKHLKPASDFHELEGEEEGSWIASGSAWLPQLWHLETHDLCLQAKPTLALGLAWPWGAFFVAAVTCRRLQILQCLNVHQWLFRGLPGLCLGYIIGPSGSPPLQPANSHCGTIWPLVVWKLKHVFLEKPVLLWRQHRHSTCGRTHMILVFLGLDYFALYDDIPFHLFSCKWQDFILLCGWMIHHCVCVCITCSLPIHHWQAPRVSS